jgi:alpha-D-ribose 1-methylphosphonate 5-triphosphate synthase subunit PhnG
MNMPTMTSNAAQKARARWMSCLSLAHPETLEKYWEKYSPKPRYRWLRAAETGLIMLRGRAGGTGQAFNLGGATATRAVVAIETPGGATTAIGFGYVTGRNTRHAELAALFDALLQDEERHAVLWRDLVEAGEAVRDAAKAERSGAVAATRVDFTTMVRGDA